MGGSIFDVVTALPGSFAELTAPLASVAPGRGPADPLARQPDASDASRVADDALGLIQAEDVNFALPEDDEYLTYELLVEVPGTLAAQERLTVPYRLTCVQDFLPDGDGQSTGGGGTLCSAMAEAYGTGHYVGNFLFVEQNQNSHYMLEGDDVVIVDTADTLNGTGLEDAYNGGFYYNWVANPMDEPEGPYPPFAIRPLNGILRVAKTASPPSWI